MAKLTINAQPRTVLGKEVKKLRRVGQLPAVVYGPAMEGVRSITLDTHEFQRVYARAGSATLLDLAVEGDATRPVLIHQVQHDATRRKLVHVDFLAPDMKVELTVAVPLAFTGEAPAVATEKGILTHLASEVQVRALPDRIPAALEVDLTALTAIGAQLTAGQVPLASGVTLVTAADEPLVRVDAPVVEQERAEAVTEETEEGDRTAEAAQTDESAAEPDTDAGAADKA